MKEDQAWIEKVIFEAAASEVEYSPTVPMEVFLSTVRPSMVRKAATLRQQRKERNERRIVWAGYLLFLILAPLYALEYVVNGFSQPIVTMLMVIGGFTLISFCCLPLVIVFKGQTNIR